MHIEDLRPPDEVERIEGLVYILQRLWTHSFTTKSDEARSYADEIAELASRGFITTAVTPRGSLHGRLWKVTVTGLEYLFANSTPALSTVSEIAYVERHTKRNGSLEGE
jgi:hypothetical protein